MTKRYLNIAIFHLAFFYSGGGEKLVLQEIDELKKLGHKVVCFVPTLDESMCYPDIIKDYPIKVFFPKLSKLFEKSETLQILSTCILFPLIVSRFKKYDVIIGANQPGPWLAYLVKKFYRKPYVVYLSQPTRILHPRRIDLENGFWVKRKSVGLPLLVKVFKRIFIFADNISIRSADCVLADGEYMYKVLKNVYGIEPVICPACVNVTKLSKIDRFSGLLEINGYNIEKPYILVTNRHFPQKRFEYAIKAMPGILKVNPHASLVITGNPTLYTKRLIELSLKLSIENKIILTGYVSEKDLISLYRNAGVYVYTSPEEDFGLGVIESMAAGVPVVAWNKAGPSKIVISGETGYLVKSNDQTSFTKRIIELLIDKKENFKMGEKAFKQANENYSCQKHIKIIEKEIYRLV